MSTGKIIAENMNNVITKLGSNTGLFSYPNAIFFLFPLTSDLPHIQLNRPPPRPMLLRPLPEKAKKFGGNPIKTSVSFSQNYRRYCLSEFSLYDGDHFITFNIVDINTDKNEITVTVSSDGKISVCTFDLKCKDGLLYFEYGVMYQMIVVDDFEHIEGD